MFVIIMTNIGQVKHVHLGTKMLHMGARLKFLQLLSEFILRDKHLA